MSESRGKEGVWTPSEFVLAYQLHSYRYNTIIKIGPRTLYPPPHPRQTQLFLESPLEKKFWIRTYTGT